MPNWVSNTLRVKGEEDAIKVFKHELNKGKDGILQLKTFVPIPKDLEETQSPVDEKKDKMKRMNLKLKYGVDNWYDWSLKNWGTKWDLNDVEMFDECEYELSFEFQTAWGPPLEGLTKISEKHSELIFLLQYEEEGCGFIGIAKMVNGNIEDKSIDF